MKSENLIECPHCMEEKAYLSKSKGTYDCKLCHESGNQYTFLRFLQKESDSTSLIKELSKRKGIPTEFLCSKGVFEHYSNVYLPVWNKEGNLIGARQFNAQENKIFNPPGFCKPNFWVWKKDVFKTFVFEADFDALAYLHQCELDGVESYNVVSLPGANVMQEWVKHFEDKDVVFCFDYDTLKGKEPNQFYPGEKGTVAAYDKLAMTVSSFSWLNWEKYKIIKRPFDVRDLYILSQKKQMDFWDVFDVCEEPFGASKEIKQVTTQEPIKSIEVTSFDDLCKRYQEVIDVTDTFRKCLACCIATIISAKTKDLNALWMFLVGPSSSGKSTILSAFNGCTEQSIHRSSITKTALVSGKASDEGKDPSILPRLKNKALIIKDLTMLLSSNSAEQEAVFGTLRDAYDQDLSLSYGNGQIRNYGDLNFSWLAGCTEIIHTFNRADVGERFLKIDIVDPAVNEFESIQRAINNRDTKSSYDYLKQVTKGFIDHLWAGNYDDPNNLPQIPDNQVKIVTCAALVISYLRTKIKVERDGTIDFRFRKEFGHRVAIQLGKLVRFLCVVFQTDRLDDQLMKDYILKVTLDTCTSIKTELVWWAMKRYKEQGGCCSAELEQDSGLGRQTVDKALKGMVEINIFEVKKQYGQSAGRPTFIYSPTSEFLAVWKGSGLYTFDYDMRKKSRVIIEPKPVKKKNVKTNV